MDIPEPLINDVRSGRVVLILGAGASIGATDKKGQPPLLGDRLRDLIADRFLGGKYKNDPLEFVAELASSETSIADVQNFIADQFRDLRPAPFHTILTTFRWRGIATTNYDRLIEDTYVASADRIQELIPFLSNSDHVDEKLRSPRHVAYIKLHGCITRTFDVNVPLILTVDQFLRHQKGRSRLYAVLKEWAHENPFVFVGHRLADYDLRSLLLDLTEEASSRPRFFLVRPNVDSAEVRFWEQKRVTVIPGSFQDFLQALNSSIAKELRPLSIAVADGHAIEKRFKVREQPSSELIDFLTNNVEYVNPAMKIAPDKPARFYRGFDVGWYAIEKNLDVRRSLTETILRDIVIRPEEDRPTSTELYAVKAEAGAGKTVFLRRLAWEAARDAEVLCLYVQHGKHLASIC